MSQDQQPIATPRTDAATSTRSGWVQNIVSADFARTLERELVQKEQENERSRLQLIDERDRAEEAISQAYYLTTGISPEWSNLWGHSQCLEEIESALIVLRDSAKALQSERDKLQQDLHFALQRLDVRQFEGQQLQEERDKLRKALEKLLEGHCEPDGSPDGGFSYCDQCKSIMEALNHSKSTTQ